MASPLEAIVVRFGAEWTGGAVINRIVSDINRMVSAGKTAGDALSMTKMLTGLESHDKAIANSAVALGKWQAHLQMVQGAINSLGMEVATGAISEADAAQRYLQLGEAAKGIKEEIASVTPVMTGFGASVSAALPYIVAVSAAAIGAAKAFQMWKESAEMGAVIRQTGDSFNYLSQNVYRIPGLLQSMRETSRGTISDMQLMASFMTLVAGTTPALGTALAEATPKLLEIAKAANALNPTLGDTTFFFDSLTRGIKRSEIRIIDNLGLNLKIGEANKRWAEQLGKTVIELTAEERQMALLNETIRVGTNLINQLGGSVDSLTDPYLQWAAQTENIKNSLHELASITFAPLAAEGAKLVTVWAAFAATVVDVVDTTDKIHTPLSKTEKTFGTLAATLAGITTDRFVPFIAALKGMTQGMGEFTDMVNKSKVGVSFEEWFSVEFERNITEFINKWLELAGLPTIDLNNRIRGLDNYINLFVPGLESSSRDVHREMEESMKSIDEAQKVAEAARAARQEYHDYMNQLRSQMPDGRIQDLAASALEREVAAIEKYNAAVAAAKQLQSGAWMDIYAGGEFNSDLVVGDIRNIGAAWITTSSATAEQNAQLVDLNKQMEEARDKLWDMENGIGVQGDEAETTAKKIANLRDEITNYEQVIAGIQQGITTSTKKVDFKLDVNDVEAYKQFITMMGEWNAPVDQLTAVAQGLGLISPAAADAMLKMTLLQGAMDKLNFKLRTGQIDASEIPQAIDNIITTVQQDKSYAEIVLDLQVRGKVTATQAQREANQARSVIADEYGQPIELGVAAPDLSTAESVMLGWLNNVEGEKPVISLEADDKAARDTFTTLTSDIEKAKPTLNIYGKYIPDPNTPGGTSTGTGIPYVPGTVPAFAKGGYISGTRGDKRLVEAHAGEFVLRPEAVDRLGIGFLMALNQGRSAPQNNSVTVQSNFYAPVGGTETKEIILRTADDGARRIADIMSRGGYKL